MRQTKIVATLSDKSDKAFIDKLYRAGMNVARINTAHADIHGAEKLIEDIRAVSDKIAIMVDTKGPEIRTCGMQNEVTVTEGQEVRFSHVNEESVTTDVFVNHSNFVFDLKVNDRILIDDGYVAVTVKEKHDKFLICTVENDGTIKNNKSVNVPGVVTNLPALSEKDKRFIDFAVKKDIDFIAHSFVRSKEDVQEVQKLLDNSKSDIKIIAKIENLEGVENIEDILTHAYGIMVARGDLGIELPPEKIPTVQRNLVRQAIKFKKPVIIATQMLHSMIEQPRPTRAEVNDVASAIYSRADAIMLSGETAIGKYPFDAVKTMVRIAHEVEPDRDNDDDVIIPPINDEIPAYLAHSAIRTARDLHPKAIITATTTGKTARYLAAYRSDVPVMAKCHSERVVRELALSFGVVPSYLEIKKNRLKIQKSAIEALLKQKVIKMEDLIIYVGGRFGEQCGASFVEISTTDKLYEFLNEKEN